MGGLWRAIYEHSVSISGLKRVGTAFEVDVTITYDDAFWWFPKERHLYCRGVGSSWEYFRPHRRDWVYVPEWLRHEINAQIVLHLRWAENVVPMKKSA